MQIIAVKLENAKSYDSALVEFAPGVNSIVGHNGAGKSTILEAIGLTVFDELRYTQSEFVRAGTRTATVTVTLESDIDGRLYDVVRRVGGTNAHFVHDPETGIRICEGKADVLDFLHEHMGVESTTDLSALFRDAVGVGQGTFTAAFLNTPANRKPIFDRLLQVEDYNKSVDALRAPVRLLRERQHELEVSIAGLEASLAVLPELERAVEVRSGELQGAQAESARARSSLENVVATRAKFEAIRSEVTDLGAQHGRALERQQALARELSAARQDRVDAEGASALVAEHMAGHERYVAAQERQMELDVKLRQRQRLQVERSQDEKAEAVTKSRLEQLAQELRAIEEAATKMAQLKDAVARQNDLETQISQAQLNVSRLQDIETQITAGHAKSTELASRLEQALEGAKRKTDLAQRAESLRTEETEAQKSIDDMRNVLARMASEAETIKEQTQALESVETALCPICEKPLTEGHRRELLQRNEGRLAKLRASYREVQDKAKGLEADSAHRRQMVDGIEREMRDLSGTAEIERLQSDVAAANTTMEHLLSQKAQVSGSALEIEKLQRQLVELGQPRNAYLLAENQVERKQPVIADYEETKKNLDSVQVKLAALDSQLQQFTNLDAELDACERESRASAEAHDIVLRNGRLASTLGERTKRVEQLVSSTAQVEAEIEALSARLATVCASYDEAAYTDVLTREQGLRTSLGMLNERIGNMKAQQETDHQKIAELHIKAETLAEAQRSHLDAAQEMEVLETIREVLRRAGPHVTRVLIRQVSDNARQIFSEIMQDYSRHLTWNEDYGITLEVGGYDRDFAQLSGGEQMTAALAVRLALVRELSDIDLAFFDEPTANLDEARRESLARQILEVKGFRQLFVISHDDTFEQATQNLIRVERTDGTSTVMLN